MPRLLLLGCSRRKHRSPGQIPAWYRYDGVLFRLCKRMTPGGSPPPQTHVRILSAEFGLLTPETPIPWYERRLDAVRAAELRPAVTDALVATLGDEGITEVYLALGRNYRAALGALPGNVRLLGSQGPIGRMQSQLRQWLAVETRGGAAQLQVNFPGAAASERTG